MNSSLMAEERPPKRVPLGPPLSLEDLLRQAPVTEADAAEAQAWVRRHSGPGERGLWEAESVDDASTETP